ncbi:MAG: ferrous iron transport protein B [Eubacterium sp.]|nr:ferrous iron transport protein B [Eubacterium sp.]
MKLNELEIGKTGIIEAVGGEGALRQHFLDMGVIPGSGITLVKYAPMGDPAEYRIHGYELTLRLEDAKEISILPESKNEKNGEIISGRKRTLKEPIVKTEHPGLGEGGRYHDPTHESPLPEGQVLSFALAGNQNCGKTTLFNQLTGANQHVGNFPGVTVDRKSGQIRGQENTEVVDLPGIYSLSPYTSEEIVSRRYILEEQPTGIINIVDATNIERNLYLTMQLMELETPMVLALNMMDEVRSNGGSIRINEMEEILGIPVVPISASKNEGVKELINHAVHIAKYQEKPKRYDFCDENDFGGAVHRCLHGIMHLIEDHAREAKIPVRFAATKIVEGDKTILEALKLDENEAEFVEHIIVQMEQERGLDRAAAIADMRFSFIMKLVKKCVIKPKESKERELSRKIDMVLTGKFTAVPSFIAIMALIFWLTFGVIGKYLQELLEHGVELLTKVVDSGLSAWNTNEVVHSLITDGVITGVGSVIVFLPIIVTLFFFLSLLEDTGYMARVAFIMDKLLRKLGLSGRSIVPLLIGFGCSVPGVMSTRTLPSERDRKMTVLLVPFMSCSAKLPIYALFSSAFFPKYAALVMTGLYFLGIIMGIILALISKTVSFKGEAVPFVMELPNYRMPSFKNTVRLLWDKSKDFLTRAFTVIFIASIVIWFLQTFNFHLEMVDGSKDSMLSIIAGWIAPIFAPLGFGDWKIATSLITGFMAKESVVSTISVLIGGTKALTSFFTVGSALSFLVFCLLYTPCVAAVSAIRRELGRKWALGLILLQCTVAWLASGAVYLIASLF